MLRVAAGVMAAVAVFAAAGMLAPSHQGAEAAADTPAAPAMADRLRYIGRDPRTGMPAAVGDRFIAEQEEARERYGKDEREPVPPPAAGPVDIAAVAIPAIGVSAAADRFGLDAYGRLDVPQDATTVGWHPAYSALPGDGGATFLAAHYEYGGRAGIFHELSTLVPGSVVTVALSDGTDVPYRVTSTVDYDLAVVDMGALLMGIEGAESLALMTCSGPFNDGTYELRTVVLAVRQEG